MHTYVHIYIYIYIYDDFSSPIIICSECINGKYVHLRYLKEQDLLTPFSKLSESIKINKNNKYQNNLVNKSQSERKKTYKRNRRLLMFKFGRLPTEKMDIF